MKFEVESEVSEKQTRKNKIHTLSRGRIKTALKQVYSKESKPIQVKSIKKQAKFALLYIYLGTILIAFSIGIKYLSLDTNLLLPGLMLLIIAFILGFTLTTKNVRKISRSMSRFKDETIPAYRTVFSERNWHKQGLVYAVLICLIFLSAQNFNFIITSNNQPFFNDSLNDDRIIVVNKNTIRLEDVILGETYSRSGQYYRHITLKINNTINYYGDNLYLIVQSFFAGVIYDELNITLNKPDSDLLRKIKIHDPDDSSIFAALKHFDEAGEHIINTINRESVDDIYIVETSGKVSSIFLSKSVEISVLVYNDRIIKDPDMVTVEVTDQIIESSKVTTITKGKIKNNETIKAEEFWGVKIKFDMLLEHESEFDIELIIEDKEKDRATVYLE